MSTLRPLEILNFYEAVPKDSDPPDGHAHPHPIPPRPAVVSLARNLNPRSLPSFPDFPIVVVSNSSHSDESPMIPIRHSLRPHDPSAAASASGFDFSPCAFDTPRDSEVEEVPCVADDVPRSLARSLGESLSYRQCARDSGESLGERLWREVQISPCAEPSPIQDVREAPEALVVVRDLEVPFWITEERCGRALVAEILCGGLVVAVEEHVRSCTVVVECAGVLCAAANDVRSLVDFEMADLGVRAAGEVLRGTGTAVVGIVSGCEERIREVDVLEDVLTSLGGDVVAEFANGLDAMQACAWPVDDVCGDPADAMLAEVVHEELEAGSCIGIFLPVPVVQARTLAETFPLFWQAMSHATQFLLDSSLIFVLQNALAQCPSSSIGVQETLVDPDLYFVRTSPPVRPEEGSVLIEVMQACEEVRSSRVPDTHLATAAPPPSERAPVDTVSDSLNNFMKLRGRQQADEPVSRNVLEQFAAAKLRVPPSIPVASYHVELADAMRKTDAVVVLPETLPRAPLVALLTANFAFLAKGGDEKMLVLTQYSDLSADPFVEVSRSLLAKAFGGTPPSSCCFMTLRDAEAGIFVDKSSFRFQASLMLCHGISGELPGSAVTFLKALRSANVNGRVSFITTNPVPFSYNVCVELSLGTVLGRTSMDEDLESSAFVSQIVEIPEPLLEVMGSLSSELQQHMLTTGIAQTSRSVPRSDQKLRSVFKSLVAEMEAGLVPEEPIKAAFLAKEVIATHKRKDILVVTNALTNAHELRESVAALTDLNAFALALPGESFRQEDERGLVLFVSWKHLQGPLDWSKFRVVVLYDEPEDTSYLNTVVEFCQQFGVAHRLRLCVTKAPTTTADIWLDCLRRRCHLSVPTVPLPISSLRGFVPELGLRSLEPSFAPAPASRCVVGNSFVCSNCDLASELSKRSVKVVGRDTLDGIPCPLVCLAPRSCLVVLSEPHTALSECLVVVGRSFGSIVVAVTGALAWSPEFIIGVDSSRFSFDVALRHCFCASQLYDLIASMATVPAATLGVDETPQEAFLTSLGFNPLVSAAILSRTSLREFVISLASGDPDLVAPELRDLVPPQLLSDVCRSFLIECSLRSPPQTGIPSARPKQVASADPSFAESPNVVQDVLASPRKPSADVSRQLDSKLERLLARAPPDRLTTPVEPLAKRRRTMSTLGFSLPPQKSGGQTTLTWLPQAAQARTVFASPAVKGSKKSVSMPVPLEHTTRAKPPSTADPSFFDQFRCQEPEPDVSDDRRPTTKQVSLATLFCKKVPRNPVTVVAAVKTTVSKAPSLRARPTGRQRGKKR